MLPGAHSGSALFDGRAEKLATARWFDFVPFDAAFDFARYMNRDLDESDKTS